MTNREAEQILKIEAEAEAAAHGAPELPGLFSATIGDVISAVQWIQRAADSLERIRRAASEIIIPPERSGAAADPERILDNNGYFWDAMPGGACYEAITEILKRYGLEAWNTDSNIIFAVGSIFTLGIVHGKRLDRQRRKRG